MALSYSYPISAINANTWREPRGPWAQPGMYTARLTANGRTMEQKLVVKLDPRVKAPGPAMQAQFDLSMRAYNGMNDSMKALLEVRAVRLQIADALAKEKSASKKKALEAEAQRVAAFEDAGFAEANQQLGQVLDLLQDVDEAPTSAATVACDQRIALLADLVSKWRAARVAARRAAGVATSPRPK